MFYKYFNGCQTLDDIKHRYRDLAKEHHPDLGGDEETFKNIQNEYEYVLKDFMDSSYQSWAEDNSEKANADYHRKPDFHTFGEILAQILEMNIRVEVIGYWIYAFDSYEYRNELKGLGFWYSKRHKAWVFNGMSKVKIRSRFSTDQLRNYLGSDLVRDKVSGSDRNEEKDKEAIA